MTPSKQKVRYAGFWIRLIAGIVDAIIVSIFINLIRPAFRDFIPGVDHQMLLHAIQRASIADLLSFAGWANLFGIVISLLYYSVLQSSKLQASLGMKLFGLKITDDKFQRISFARALGREICAYLSAFILFIGYIMIAFTKHKQGLHDLIADTYVVRR